MACTAASCIHGRRAKALQPYRRKYLKKAKKMESLFGYPSRVTKQPNGTYWWFHRIDTKYYRDREIYPAVWACGFIAAFVMGYGLVLTILFDDWENFWIVALCDLVFILISAVVIRLFGWGTGKTKIDPKEMYILSDTYIKTGSGKSSVYFDFKGTRQITVTAGYLELKGKIKSTRIYVPEEDMAFVKGYVMNRMPGDVEIRYEKASSEQ